MLVSTPEENQSKNLFQVKIDLAAHTESLGTLFLSAFIIDLWL